MKFSLLERMVFTMVDPKHGEKKKTKGFAKAFKLDIGREKDIIDEKWRIGSGRSLLMNTTRQNIFRYLCEYPCSALSTIANDLGLSPATMSWHLKLLLKNKLISESRSNSQRLYYPWNMVNQSAIPVLALLSKPRIQKLFVKILHTPGIKQKDLSEYFGLGHQSINSFTNQLKDVELINVVRDGKYTRYYPTSKLEDLEMAQRKNLKVFRNWVIRALKMDGVNPKLVRATENKLFLKITTGTELENFLLSVNPFRSTLQERGRFLAEL